MPEPTIFGLPFLPVYGMFVGLVVVVTWLYWHATDKYPKTAKRATPIFQIVYSLIPAIMVVNGWNQDVFNVWVSTIAVSLPALAVGWWITKSNDNKPIVLALVVATFFASGVDMMAGHFWTQVWVSVVVALGFAVAYGQHAMALAKGVSEVKVDFIPEWAWALIPMYQTIKFFLARRAINKDYEKSETKLMDVAQHNAFKDVGLYDIGSFVRGNKKLSEAYLEKYPILGLTKRNRFYIKLARIMLVIALGIFSCSIIWNVFTAPSAGNGVNNTQVPVDQIIVPTFPSGQGQQDVQPTAIVPSLTPQPTHTAVAPSNCFNCATVVPPANNAQPTPIDGGSKG